MYGIFDDIYIYIYDNFIAFGADFLWFGAGPKMERGSTESYTLFFTVTFSINPPVGGNGGNRWAQEKATYMQLNA